MATTFTCLVLCMLFLDKVVSKDIDSINIEKLRRGRRQDTTPTATTYTSTPNSIYRYTFSGSERLSFVNAREKCKTEGGDLWWVDDVRDMSWLTAELNGGSLNTGTFFFWIGCSSPTGVGSDWAWARTGQSCSSDDSLHSWASGLPQNANPTVNCSAGTLEGTWYSRQCGNELSYLCKIPITTTTTGSTVTETLTFTSTTVTLTSTTSVTTATKTTATKTTISTVSSTTDTTVTITSTSGTITSTTTTLTTKTVSTTSSSITSSSTETTVTTGVCDGTPDSIACIDLVVTPGCEEMIGDLVVKDLCPVLCDNCPTTTQTSTATTTPTTAALTCEECPCRLDVLPGVAQGIGKSFCLPYVEPATEECLQDYRVFKCKDGFSTGTSTITSSLSSTASSSVTTTQSYSQTTTFTSTATSTLSATATTTLSQTPTTSVTSTVTTSLGGVHCINTFNPSLQQLAARPCHGVKKTIQRALEACFSPEYNETLFGILVCKESSVSGEVVLATSPASLCPLHSRFMNQLLARVTEFDPVYTMREGTIECAGDGTFYSSPETCEVDAQGLTAVQDGFLDGSFITCGKTTPTTTQTSTETTTVTTQLTGGLECTEPLRGTKTNFLTARSTLPEYDMYFCQQQANELNKLFDACDLSPSGYAVFACSMVLDAPRLAVAPVLECPEQVKLLNELAVEAHKIDGGFHSQVSCDYSCDPAGFVVALDADICTGCIDSLNAVVTSSYNGLLSRCEVTSPTSSATSSVSSTASSSVSSSMSSSVSSTASTSESSTQTSSVSSTDTSSVSTTVSSSASTTISSSASSSQSSTVTTTQTTTATFTVSSTATSSVSSSASTSVSSTASSTVSSTVTTSATSTQSQTATTTPSSSVTSTATSTQTSSVTTTPTSSATTTVTTSATSTPSSSVSSTATTTVSSTVSSSATTSVSSTASSTVSSTATSTITSSHTSTQTTIDECQEVIHNCHNDAACSDTLEGFMCTCNLGYSGDGFSCLDIDECLATEGLVDDCNSDASCTNTNGSFTCTCDVGYSGDGVACDNVDECDIDTHSCDKNATCSDITGSFTCSCDIGYSGDGVSCLNVDECEAKSDSCSRVSEFCTDSDGSFICSCLLGFERASSNETCVDTNECENSDATTGCTADATCTNTLGSYRCECDAGYKGFGLLGSTCEDVDECKYTGDLLDVICSKEHSKCTNIIGSFVCPCEEGYEGNETLGDDPCDNINECLATPCHTNASCTDSAGSFSCSCLDGFAGSGLECEDVQECSLTGSDAVCHDDATCTEEIGSFTCECKSGFAGIGTQCDDILECAATDRCHPDATCTELPGSFSCGCNAGYEGSGTVTCDDIDECGLTPSVCDANANCRNTVGSYECTCTAGWVSDGTSNTTDEAVACVDVDECNDGVENRCSPHATCSNTMGSFECNCDLGWSGPAITEFGCQDDNECAGSTLCNANANCINTPGSYTCACHDSFVDVGSEPGLRCEDKNECEGSPCHPQAACSNTIGSYTCACNAGWLGSGLTDTNTSAGCIDFDECVEFELYGGPDVCPQVGDTCVNTMGSFSCVCDTGFTPSGLPTGNTCVDVDECLSQIEDPCVNGQCVNTIGSFGCACVSGYTNDPRDGVCRDVDECALHEDMLVDDRPCTVGSSTCIDTEGSFVCCEDNSVMLVYVLNLLYEEDIGIVSCTAAQFFCDDEEFGEYVRYHCPHTCQLCNDEYLNRASQALPIVTPVGFTTAGPSSQPAATTPLAEFERSVRIQFTTDISLLVNNLDDEQVFINTLAAHLRTVVPSLAESILVTGTVDADSGETVLLLGANGGDNELVMLVLASSDISNLRDTSGISFVFRGTLVTTAITTPAASTTTEDVALATLPLPDSNVEASTSEDDGFSEYMYILVVVGGLLLLALIVCVVYTCCCGANDNQKRGSFAPEATTIQPLPQKEQPSQFIPKEIDFAGKLNETVNDGELNQSNYTMLGDSFIYDGFVVRQPANNNYVESEANQYSFTEEQPRRGSAWEMIQSLVNPEVEVSDTPQIVDDVARLPSDEDMDMYREMLESPPAGLEPNRGKARALDGAYFHEKARAQGTSVRSFMRHEDGAGPDIPDFEEPSLPGYTSADQQRVDDGYIDVVERPEKAGPPPLVPVDNNPPPPPTNGDVFSGFEGYKNLSYENGPNDNNSNNNNDDNGPAPETLLLQEILSFEDSAAKEAQQ
eukprot:m.144561 g.144561  ORF g.144561 m.144561 type:complete len:2203 (-) comp14926_c0_seq1:193-6801(-)